MLYTDEQLEALAKNGFFNRFSFKPPQENQLSGLLGASWLIDKDWLKPTENMDINLDIGSGSGRFLLREGSRRKSEKFLGVDIDYPCAKKVLEKLYKRKLSGENLENVRYFHGSIYHLHPYLQPNSIRRVYINYPDPWFKKRHLKRRLVQGTLFDYLAPALQDGAEFFIQTDIEDYAKMITEILESRRDFKIKTFADSLFAGLSTTLYQEKAMNNGLPRFCFYMRYEKG